MQLYDRDYNTVTELETQTYEEILLKEKEDPVALKNLGARKNLFREYPKAIRHNHSLFPNNYLDIVDLDNRETITSTLDNFITGLSTGKIKKEADILEFINIKNKAFYFIASIFNYYDFGHHEAFIFPEFQLSDQYRVDYLLIGKNSSGYSFIFVELEDPLRQITLKKGELGVTFRKGINQIKDWRRFLEANFTSFTNTLRSKYRNTKLNWPDEFTIPDPTRYHFVVVAGMRKDFEHTNTRRTAREHLDEQKIRLLHYENLYDNTIAVMNQRNY